MRFFRYSTILFLVGLLFQSCFSLKYDFKGGAQIDPKIKTVSVQYIANRALRVNPTLSQTLTDKLKAYMESNTSMKVVNSIGDVDFSGEVTEYSFRSVATGAGDKQSQTRFTITLRIKYSNFVKPEDNFDSSFSQYKDFPGTKSFGEVEEELSTVIVDELIEQIFNKAFVNW
jgi:hypothetical protein